MELGTECLGYDLVEGEECVWRSVAGGWETLLCDFWNGWDVARRATYASTTIPRYELSGSALQGGTPLESQTETC